MRCYVTMPHWAEQTCYFSTTYSSLKPILLLEYPHVCNMYVHDHAILGWANILCLHFSSNPPPLLWELIPCAPFVFSQGWLVLMSLCYHIIMVCAYLYSHLCVHIIINDKHMTHCEYWINMQAYSAYIHIHIQFGCYQHRYERGEGWSVAL